MNVLSLFDGISAGILALERANIKINNYYSSEIDEYCIKISNNNYKDIIQLGDITSLSVEKLPKIDLLIGGSPCQAFSLAGKRLGFISDNAKLFFEFVRILNKIKPKYFLFENTDMKQEHRDIITNNLGVNPIILNSSKFSAQRRKRLYWTNILFDIPINDHPIKFQDILESGVVDKEKAYCLTASYSHITANMCDINRYYNKHIHNFVKEDKIKYGHRKLSVIECERLQTFPDNYTNMEIVPIKERYRALGNSWTVDTISHILKGIKN